MHVPVCPLQRRKSARAPEKATLMTNMEGRNVHMEGFANDLYNAEEVLAAVFQYATGNSDASGSRKLGISNYRQLRSRLFGLMFCL